MRKTLLFLVLAVCLSASVDCEVLFFNTRDYPDVRIYFDHIPPTGVSITSEKGAEVKIHGREKTSEGEIALMVYPFSDDRNFINYVHNLCSLVLSGLSDRFTTLLSRIFEDELRMSVYFDTEKDYVYYPVEEVKEDAVTGDRNREFFSADRSSLLNRISAINLSKNGIFYDSLVRMTSFLYHQSRSIPYLVVLLDGDVIFEDSRSTSDHNTLNALLEERNFFIDFVVLYSSAVKKIPPVIDRIRNKRVYQVLQTDLSSDETGKLTETMLKPFYVLLNLKDYKKKGETVKLNISGKDLDRKIEFSVPYNLDSADSMLVIAPKSVNNPYADFTYTVTSSGRKLYEGSLKAGKSISYSVPEGKYNVRISDTFFEKDILKNCFKGDTVIADPVFVYSDLTFVSKDSFDRPISVNYRVMSNGRTVASGATGTMGTAVIKLLNNNLFRLESEMGLNRFSSEITPFGDTSESIRRNARFFVKNYYINTKDLNGSDVDSFYFFSVGGETVLTGETRGQKLLDIPPGEYKVTIFWGNERKVQQVKVDEGRFSGLTCNFSTVKMELLFSGDLEKRNVILKVLDSDSDRMVYSQKVESNSTTVNIAPGNYVLKVQSFNEKNESEVDFTQSVKVYKDVKNFFKIDLYNANLSFELSDLKGLVESAPFTLHKVNENTVVPYKNGLIKSGHIVNVLPGEYLVSVTHGGIKWEKRVIVNKNEFKKLAVQFFGIIEAGVKVIDSKGDTSRPDDYYLKMDGGEWLHVEANPLKLLLNPGKKKIVIKREKYSKIHIERDVEIQPGEFLRVDVEFFRLLKIKFDQKLLKKSNFLITDYGDRKLFDEQSVRKADYEYWLPLDKYRLKVRKSNQDSFFFVKEIFDSEPGTVEVSVDQ